MVNSFNDNFKWHDKHAQCIASSPRPIPSIPSFSMLHTEKWALFSVQHWKAGNAGNGPGTSIQQLHAHCILHYIGKLSLIIIMEVQCVCMHQCSPDMVKDGGGAVILLLTSAQYLSGMPTAFSSASFRCLISSSFLRLHMIIALIIIQNTLGTVTERYYNHYSLMPTPLLCAKSRGVWAQLWD